MTRFLAACWKAESRNKLGSGTEQGSVFHWERCFSIASTEAPGSQSLLAQASLAPKRNVQLSPGSPGFGKVIATCEWCFRGAEQK